MAFSGNFQGALDLIKKSNKIVLTSHVRPDGDACGSMIAVKEFLSSMGKNCDLMLLSELPQWYKFLFDENTPIYGQSTVKKDLNEYDLIILVDVNSESQLQGFADFIKKTSAKVLIFDHHATNDGLGDIEIIDFSAAATGLIIFDMFKFAGFKIDEKIAEALFVAISTDTGWFQFSNTDTRVFATAAKLIEAGAKPTDLYHKLYHNFTPHRFELLKRMLNSLELLLDDRYAVQHLTQKDFQETGTAYSDTENLVDMCRRINTIQAAALFVEQPDGRIRCSLRSTGKVDVSRVAQTYGGGGHTVASGVHLEGPLEDAKQKIFELIKQQLD